MENISSKRLVDISSLMEYLSLGRNSALKFGEESGAKLKVGRRTLYDLQIKKFRENYEKQHGHMPDNALVMREFLISRDYLQELDILKDLKITSIDVPIGEDDESTLAELLPGETDLEEKTVKRLSIAEFWEILNDVLLPAESEIIKLFYLDNLTVSKIAEHTGDTEQQIRQLQQQALKKLRMRKKIKEII